MTSNRLRSFLWLQTRLPSLCKPLSVIFLRQARRISPRTVAKPKKLLSLAIGSGVGVALCASYADNKVKELLRSSTTGDLGKSRSLIRSGVDVNATHELGWSALHAAVINGHPQVVKALIEAGADVDAEDGFSSPAEMRHTTGRSFDEIVNLRETDFCDKFTRRANFSGFTPLHYAVVLGDKEIVNLLLKAGADPKKTNSQGFSSLNYARNDPDLYVVLRSAADQYEELKRKRDLEERKRFPLEARIRQRLVGQEGAITTVGATVRRKENGWQDEDRPLVFLFLGSSGIGKTELAKQLANYIHKGSRKGFIRLDMSEYQTKHEVAKLIGAPPGYIGHDQGGQLTKQLKEYPNAVVLFDEVEKAHPDVLTVMLQLFDEGRLTDGQGKTIDCKDAIFVMTSNLASDEIAAHGVQLRKDAERASRELRKQDPSKQDFGENLTISRTFREQVVQPILKRHFLRNEFLGRINEIIYFLPFSKKELRELVNRELQWWAKRAHDKHKIELVWDAPVVDILAEGYDVHYGARSIKHEVERRVINQLASAHEKGLVVAGNRLHVYLDKKEQSLIRVRAVCPGQNSVDVSS